MQFPFQLSVMYLERATFSKLFKLVSIGFLNIAFLPCLSLRMINAMILNNWMRIGNDQMRIVIFCWNSKTIIKDGRISREFHIKTFNFGCQEPGRYYCGYKDGEENLNRFLADLASSPGLFSSCQCRTRHTSKGM